jgi:hypothetical protein
LIFSNIIQVENNIGSNPNSSRSNIHNSNSLEDHYEKIASMAKEGKRGLPN